MSEKRVLALLDGARTRTMNAADTPSSPAHSIESEQALLGAVLLDNSVLKALRGKITAADFFASSHRELWRAACDLVDAGHPAGVVSVLEHLREGGKAGDVGGLEYLHELAHCAPGSASAPRHALIVSQHARRREYAALGATLQDSALRPGVDLATLRALVDEGLRGLQPPESAAPMQWDALSERDAPSRDWLVPQWIPKGVPVLFAGKGGEGKTSVMQALVSAGAIGAEYIGASGRFSSLMWGCEDDHDEFWRKQVDIAAHFKVPLAAFAGRFHMVPRVGMDNVLASSEYGRIMFTPRLEELRQQANDLGVDVVVLDNVRHLFAIDENNNAMVTQAINGVTGRLAGKTVIFVGHVSRAEGSEYANGAAWENAVRARLYLGKKAPGEKAESGEEPDPNARVLARRKANYASEDLIRLRYDRGVFVPEEREAIGTGMVGHLRRARAERTLLAAAQRIAGMGEIFTSAANSPRYLPQLILDYKLGEGATKRELADAMRDAMLDGRLVKGEVGKYGNRTPQMGLKVVP